MDDLVVRHDRTFGGNRIYPRGVTGNFVIVLTIEIENPRQDDVLVLLRQVDDYALSLYLAENYHGLDLIALENPEVAFHVARDSGLAVGTAAIVDRGNGSGELIGKYVDDPTSYCMEKRL